jgi:CRP/FNR family transcriptional regulator
LSGRNQTLDVTTEQGKIMTTREFIRGVPLFRGLEERFLASIENVAVKTRFEKGRTIFLEGGEAGGFYVVLSGQVKIFKLSSEGKEQIIHIYGPGQSFGEVPMFEGGRFPANAETTRVSDLLYVPRSELLLKMKREPELAMNMLGEMAKKLRAFTVQIENLTLKETPQRLAAYLLDVSEREGGEAGAEEITLDMTKGHLAGLLGTAQETLSRVLARMSEAGLIEVKGRRITLLDRPGLESLAEGDETPR